MTPLRERKRESVKRMKLAEILAEDERLKALPMGPERWIGSITLRRVKANCLVYKKDGQDRYFWQWMLDLEEASKRIGVDWGSDDIRALYIEGQPEVWVDSYDDGDSPDEAIAHDMEAWD